jgi:hypothetical protein
VAKQTGIGANLYVDEYDLSGDVGAVGTIGSSRTQLDVTGINKDFMERLPGLGDGQISYTGFYNPAGAHAVLAPIGTAAQHVTVTLGTAVGAGAASLHGVEVNFDKTRGNDGSLVFSTEALSHAGFGTEWGFLLTAGKATAAGSGTATSTVDNAVATSNGGAAFLHAFSIGSGTATVIVEHSTDNATFASITGGTFAAFSAATSERITLTGTINRYTRYNATGTFGTAVFAVNINRK